MTELNGAEAEEDRMAITEIVLKLMKQIGR
jgi:hypothetical protein